MFNWKKKSSKKKGSSLVRAGSHGEHWAAVIDDPMRIIADLEKHIDNSKTFEMESPPEDDVKKILGVPAVMPGEMFLIHQLAGDGAGRYELRTGYAATRADSPCSASLKAIRIWKGYPSEAYMQIEIEGIPLTVFAIDYFVHHEEYHKAKELPLGLSALVYGLDIDPPGAREADFAAIPGAHSTTSGQFFVPLDSSHEDDYYVYGPLKEIAPANPFGLPGYRLVVECLPLGSIPMFCLEGRMERVPRVGEPVGANLWMQGRIAHGRFGAISELLDNT